MHILMMSLLRSFDSLDPIFGVLFTVLRVLVLLRNRKGRVVLQLGRFVFYCAVTPYLTDGRTSRVCSLDIRVGYQTYFCLWWIVWSSPLKTSSMHRCIRTRDLQSLGNRAQRSHRRSHHESGAGPILNLHQSVPRMSQLSRVRTMYSGVYPY